MSRHVPLIALFVVSSFMLCFSGAEGVQCGAKGETEMDQVVGLIMTIGTERKFPSNKAELKAFCKDQSSYAARLEEYKNTCLSTRAKQIVSVISYSIKSLINSYCKHPNSKRTLELLNSAPCANAATNDYNKCQIEYTERLMAALSSKLESKALLAQACCGYTRIHACVRRSAAAYPSVCSEKSIDANVAYNRGFFDNAIDVICGEYTEASDKCDKVKLLSGGKKKQKVPKSFFNPLVSVLSRL